MTVTTAGTEAVARLDLGWVIGRTLAVLRARLLDLLILGLPFIYIPDALASFLPDDLLGLRLLSSLPNLVFAGGVSLMAFREISGGARITAHEAMIAGLSRFGTIWAVGFLSGLGILGGLILLIAPGIFLSAAWMPATSVVMVEQQGSTQALKRAWQLTEGCRWPLVGLLGIAFGIVLALLLPIFLVSFGLGATLGATLAEKVADITVTPLFDVALLSISTIGATAAYAGLRLAKEGSLGEVAEVFA